MGEPTPFRTVTGGGRYAILIGRLRDLGRAYAILIGAFAILTGVTRNAGGTERAFTFAQVERLRNGCNARNAYKRKDTRIHARAVQDFSADRPLRLLWGRLQLWARGRLPIERLSGAL
jgi:hypothetical protein